MSEQAPEWTPPADAADEIPGAPEDTGPPAALENIPSYLESAEGALAQCRKLAAPSAAGKLDAAAVMHAFAAVAQAFATLHLAEQTHAANRRTETERA